MLHMMENTINAIEMLPYKSLYLCISRYSLIVPILQLISHFRAKYQNIIKKWQCHIQFIL